MWNMVVVNSSPPSAAYMLLWSEASSVQVMACRLLDAKPLHEPMLTYCQLNPQEPLQWNSNQNTKIFIYENASENIACEMAAILSRIRWVNWSLSIFTDINKHITEVVHCIIYSLATPLKPTGTPDDTWMIYYGWPLICMYRQAAKLSFTFCAR